MTHYDVTFLVVGGGIAGVTCAETLGICCPEERLLLITESNFIKTVENLEPISRYLCRFDVREQSTELGRENCKFSKYAQTVVDKVEHIDSKNREVLTFGKKRIKYRYMCICTGGCPRLIDYNTPAVIGIRDTDSVLQLRKRLQNAQCIVLVGNGGIASELVHELRGVEVHWVIRDNHISSTFADAGIAHFFLESRNKYIADYNKPEEMPSSFQTVQPTASTSIKRLRYAEMFPRQEHSQGLSSKAGVALGPDWHRNFPLYPVGVNTFSIPIIHYQSNVESITSLETSHKKQQLSVALTSGQTISCDFLVSATGVISRQDFTCDKQFELAQDGGICVNDLMETSLPHIYAAGDVCTADWEPSPHWMQKRLWTQARQMGAMAGRSMAAAFCGDRIYQDFCFEIFEHATELFGYPVVFLGRYNGQGLGNDYEILMRTTPSKEYIKLVLQGGRLRGAILIGNTDLAETCENLILNGIDLTPFGDDILNPEIDIEDYFD